MTGEHEMTRDECLKILKKYDNDLYEYYCENAWSFGIHAYNYARYLLEKFGEKSISMEQFKNGIKLVLKTDDEDLSFSTMSNMFYADYHPKYPEKSAADMTISYNWVTREGEIRGNLQALIPTIKKYNGFLFMLKDLKEMEVE